MSSLISTHLIKKTIPNPATHSLSPIPKSRTLLSPFTAIKLAVHNPPDISLQTLPAQMANEVPTTPNVPDFDPVPPEKPADPPPMSPEPVKPDPEIEPPGPDMPVPPNTPGGPEVVQPPTTPEWVPPDRPDIGPQAPPEIQLPYAGGVVMF